MQYREAVKDFRQLNKAVYERGATRQDAEAAWAAHKELLKADGWITQKQFDTWSAPFKTNRSMKTGNWFSW